MKRSRDSFFLSSSINHYQTGDKTEKENSPMNNHPSLKVCIYILDEINTWLFIYDVHFFHPQMSLLMIISIIT